MHVSLKEKCKLSLGQSVRGVQEFRRCQGGTRQLPGGESIVVAEVAVIVSLEGGRGDDREGYTSQQPVVVEVFGGWGADVNTGSGSS